MSWPTDGEPRFVVGSVTGFNYPGGFDSKEATFWTVHDRAYCYHIVWRQIRHSSRREAYARALAASLNAEYEKAQAA